MNGRTRTNHFIGPYWTLMDLIGTYRMLWTSSDFVPVVIVAMLKSFIVFDFAKLLFSCHQVDVQSAYVRQFPDLSHHTSHLLILSHCLLSLY